MNILITLMSIVSLIIATHISLKSHMHADIDLNDINKIEKVVQVVEIDAAKEI